MKKKDFESISVSRVIDSDGRKKLIINNPTDYTLIGKGVQGAVFQLDEDRCVKFYVKKSFVDKEMEAYAAAKQLSFIPKFYERGSNYIVMEYIKGPSLFKYLQKLNHLSKSLAQQILMIHRELKIIGFTRIESKLGHFIVTEGEVLKFVDHSDAFSYVQSYPNELFTDLKKIGLLQSFLKHAKELDPEQYSEWEKAVDLETLVNERSEKMNKREVAQNLPKVTVIIPTYNRAGMIHRAINSLKEQSLKQWKAIIMDDGSTDNTQQVIEELIINDKRFTYFNMEQNVGICNVLNQALKLVDTKYMVQLDSDDWLEKIALERLLQGMEAEPDSTALIYGNYKEWESLEEGNLVTVREFNSSDKYDLISYVPMVYPRFYRTACLRKVGGWEVKDKYNGRFMEDRRILFKLIETYNFRKVDEHLYNLSRFHSTRLTTDDNIDKYAEIKKELVLRTLKKWGDEYRPIFSYQNKKSEKKSWLRIKLMPNKKTIGHIMTEYLPLTETFVYQQIVRNSDFNNVAFTPKVSNKEIFPIEHLVEVKKNTDLANELSNYRVDMLHAHFGPSALFALQAKEELGIPMLTFVHGYDARKYPYMNNKVGDYRKLFTSGELFLVPSNAIKQELLSLGCPETKVRVAHLGIDIDQFQYQSRKLKDKNGLIEIVSVGRLIEKKGHHILIEALSKVKKKMSNFRLTIVGDGPDRPALVEQINRLGLDRHIQLAGNQQHAEVRNILNQAHIFCLASAAGKDGNMEGLPVSILEAQAVGLPVVSTRHSGIPEGVIEGGSALLAAENDPVDLAIKLIEMMSQPEKWSKIGLKGRKWVVQHFNAAKQAEELRDIYLELLRGDQ